MSCPYPKHDEFADSGEPCPLCEGEEAEKHELSMKKKGGRPPKVQHLPGANLFFGSNPQPSAPLFDNTVDGKRKIHCKRYENCLLYAMKMGWSSFDCLDCCVEEKISKEEFERDLEGLAALLRAWSGR